MGMNNRIKVLEMFGGIGAPRKALENLGINIKSVDYVEILDYAVTAYNSMYNNSYKPNSVIDWNINVDILIHGSPCQDFSIAGKGDVENGGRSNLYTETLKIIDKVLNPRPKIVIWENVKGLISKKHITHFNHYLDSLDKIGYNNYHKVLIATDFGIPQKRERIFVVSILKDFDDGSFSFDNLEKKEMKKLKDLLEPCVDINYFLKQESMIKAVKEGKIKIINNNNENLFDKCNTITTKQWRWNNAGVIRIPLENYNQTNYVYIETYNSKNYYVLPRAKDGELISGAYNRAYKDEDCVPVGTVTASNIIKILKPKQEIINIIETKQKEFKEINKTIEQENNNIQKYNEWAQTQEGQPLKEQKELLVVEQGLNEFNKLPVFIINDKHYVLRILTERECWRLMGFTDQDFNNAQQAGIPKNALYALAGNSIVVQVLEAIFKEVIKIFKNNGLYGGG